MTKSELIVALHRIPGNPIVYYYYDGAARGGVREVYLSRGGDLVLTDNSDEPPMYKKDERI